jgi:undecaprenyl-diphosphatase
MTSWDLSLLHQINTAWSHPVLDWLMPALSAIEAWLPLIIAAVLLSAWRGGKRARVMLLCLGIAIGLGDGVISNTLKKTIGRVRPRDAMEGVIVRDLGIASPAFMRLFEKPVKALRTERRNTRQVLPLQPYRQHVRRRHGHRLLLSSRRPCDVSAGRGGRVFTHLLRCALAQ